MPRFVQLYLGKSNNKSVGIFQTNLTEKFKEENGTHGVENENR